MTESGRDPIAGWDIGGAHVKLAIRYAKSIVIHQWACPLWQGLVHLENLLAEVKQNHPMLNAEHRVTMTGELVDLFSTRTNGVKEILDAFARYFPNLKKNFVFSTDGLLSFDSARICMDRVASANWLSTVQAVSRRCQQGVVVDIGSTTTDVMAFVQNQPCMQGYNDHERLKSYELLYAGVVRTGINHLVPSLPFKGETVPVVAEYFANMADVYRILQCLPAHADLYPSADSAGKSKHESLVRFARMLCLDYDLADQADWEKAAEYVAAAQCSAVLNAIRLRAKRCKISEGVLVGAGVGRFILNDLARRMEWDYIAFDQLLVNQGYHLDERSADCAPAVSLVL